MVQQKKYCTNCGSELAEGARFCASCGHPVPGEDPTLPSPADQAQSSGSNQNGETLIGAATGLERKKGLFKTDTFTMIVTDKRLIFAKVTNEILKEQAAQLKGQGFMARMQASMSGDHITSRYDNIAPEQALAENSDNFAVDRSEIKKIKFNINLVDTDSKRDNDVKMEIQTVREKLQFKLRNHGRVAEILKQTGLV